jgi:threonine/homoserine/homoserine lactone efflux protein
MYLIWLGVTTLMNPSEVHAADEPARTSPLRQAGRGFGVSGLNPKVFLLFLALLPQFVRPAAAWPVPAQMLVLGGIHVANCAVVYLVVAATARWLLRTRPSAARAVSRASGVIMTLLGIWLLGEQFLSWTGAPG